MCGNLVESSILPRQTKLLAIKLTAAKIGLAFVLILGFYLLWGSSLGVNEMTEVKLKTKK